jgi:1-acyl-sn-glycerol-3-phosphate acyltransferase
MFSLTTSVVSCLLWVSSIFSFIVFGLGFIVASFVTPVQWLQPLGRWVSRIILLAAGQLIEVTDAFPSPNKGPYIYMFNHTSLLDTFILIATIPEFTAAIGKAEQFKIPIWGHILRRWGAVPIHRGELSRAISALSAVEASLQSGRSLLISPEGTRSADGRLTTFKKGPFHVAMNVPTPIVPIAIVGAFKAKSKGSWLLRPNRIQVRIAPLIERSHSGFESKEKLSGVTRAAIAGCLPKEQR